ncbi:MAG TPA: NAD-dependent epimerase/dehydratase family protein [Cyclobacteriaceae bacterium]
MTKVLVTGANGQLGSEITLALREIYSENSVIASDINPVRDILSNGPFKQLNVLDQKAISEIILKEKITEIYHLAAILSATGERAPLTTWNINVQGLLNILENSRKNQINKVFWPSSIAIFGNSTPKNQTPQKTIMEPATVYGISKLTGERWCEYYHLKYGLDVRSIRYPGLISYKVKPGGGTTDYVMDMFNALKSIPHDYECYLKKNTELPMMYIDDAIRGTMELMETEKSKLSVRSSYNLSAMSFTPEDLYMELLKFEPAFKVKYSPDYRQSIADSWPDSIDDSIARKDWRWNHCFSLSKMTEEIIKNNMVSYI